MAHNLRYSTKEELNWFLNDLNHTQIFLGSVQGLVDVQVQEDLSGAFMLIKVQEGIDPSDCRSRTFEELAGLEFTTLSGEHVRTKTKLEWV